MGNEAKKTTGQSKAGRNAALLLAGLFLALGIYWVRNEPSREPQPQAPLLTGATSGPIEQVPPYYLDPQEAKPFPRLLPAAYFQDYPVVAQAYRMAAEIPEVIAQQPCYCYCDKFGHRSLLDCYSSDHGAG